jgi:hypothetical protein
LVPRTKRENARAAAIRTPVSESESALVTAPSAFGVPAHAALFNGGGFLTGWVAHQCPSYGLER